MSAARGSSSSLSDSGSLKRRGSGGGPLHALRESEMRMSKRLAVMILSAAILRHLRELRLKLSDVFGHRFILGFEFYDQLFDLPKSL